MDNIPGFKKIKKYFSKRRVHPDHEIAPDEIFLDSSNLPDFDTHQFEGRIEKPISPRTTLIVGLVFAAIGLIFIYRLWDLQIHQGASFAARSQSNVLHQTLVFPDRGVIYDRNHQLLAWNIENPANADVPLREYSTTTGLSNLLGYVKYPSKDSSGFYYREDYVGEDGVEKFFDTSLKGQNGTKLTETDAFGHVISESTMNPPVNGTNLTLSIDSIIQSRLYDTIQSVAHDYGYDGGAGIIMSVKTGEVYADVTYPSYSSQVMTDGTDTAQIDEYLTDPATPLLNRATSGLYTPGSIVKPVMALGALDTGVITPDKVLYTTGSISIKNPYDPSVTYVYRDWQNQGAENMYKAIQESSDVYFYEVGGGYGDQPGMGIANIDKYTSMFGYGKPVGSPFFGNQSGTVPSPAWKAANFDGEQWTIGDTYHTVIGQYGFQVTPLQVVRAIAAVANDGTLLEPTIIDGDTSMLKDAVHIDLPKADFDAVHQGMRQSAEQGTASALNVTYEQFAAKTGTAQLGPNNSYANSWITGFFPFDNPQYAFVILMEHSKAGNLIGAPFVARQLFDWMDQNTPQYFSTP